MFCRTTLFCEGGVDRSESHLHSPPIHVLYGFVVCYVFRKKMPDLPAPCGIIRRWRERHSRVVVEVPAHLRQRVPNNIRPLIYYDEPIVHRSYDEHPEAVAEREARFAQWPIFDPPYEVINWEGDIRPLPGYEAWVRFLCSVFRKIQL